MVDAHDQAFGVHTGQWAEPDVGHLCKLMREAFENRSELAKKGIEARKTAEHFSWDNAASVAVATIADQLHAK
jgi:hypothetical protein